MRRVLGGVAAALLALTAVPALAADEPAGAEAPAVLAACEGVADGDRLDLEGLEEALATPLLPGDVTTRTYVLDLAGQPVGTSGAVTGVLTWGLPANDYDLDVNEGSGANFNFSETAPSETAGTLVEHCGSVVVGALNFAAPVVVDSLEIALTVQPFEPFEDF